MGETDRALLCVGAVVIVILWLCKILGVVP